jgi:hypothetical protein
MTLPSRRSVGVGVAAAVLTYLLLNGSPWPTVPGTRREKVPQPPRSGGAWMLWKELEQPCPEIPLRILLKRRLAREVAQGGRTLLESVR